MLREEFTESEVDLRNLSGFTLRDFGVPQIVELQIKIDEAMALVESDESEASS